MLAKEISSLQHPIVKLFVKLRDSRKDRYAEKQIPIMGIKQVEEASSVEILFTLPSFQTDVQAGEHYHVTEEILKKMTGQPSPEPICALVEMPPFADLSQKTRLLALDGVADPGNVGTLLRTALALGFDGAFLLEGCADPFNDKALRSAMGAALRLPLCLGTEEEFMDLAKNFTPLVADMGGSPLGELKSIERPLLILGSEAQGVSSTLKNLYPTVSIPIQGVESLNVAAAGAIMMYHFTHER